MTSRERVKKALRHEEVDRFPRHLWALPNIFMFKSEQLGDLLKKFESDFDGPTFSFGKSRYEHGIPNRIGNYVDEFGCTWDVAEDGIIGEVKHPILRNGMHLTAINCLGRY